MTAIYANKTSRLSFTLSETARAHLSNVSTLTGLTQSDYIEALIRSESNTLTKIDVVSLKDILKKDTVCVGLTEESKKRIRARASELDTSISACLEILIRKEIYDRV